MTLNYFKTGLRALRRNKTYAVINVGGLAVGIAVCIIIFIIIQFQLSFENFHSKKDRIYRVLTEYHHADAANIFYGAGVPQPMPQALKTSFPQIEKLATICADYNSQFLVLDDKGQAIKKFKEERGVFFTEPSLFDIFDFKWLAGNPATALKERNSAVLSREIAEKYFGDWRSAVGKTIKWNNEAVLNITGVLASIPANTDLQLKVVIAYGTAFTANFARSTDWDGTGSSFGCYILLPANVSVASFNTQLRALAKKKKSPGNKDSHIIQPLSKVHYDTQAGNFSGKSISPQLIRVLWLIAAFILIIACVNFVNLATAQAVNRSKEVGVRKVLGSNRKQLKLQFISETFLVVIAAIVVAIGITSLALPYIDKILDLPLSNNPFQHPSILFFLLFIAIVVTLLAGFYPSIVLSRFNPINALKNKQVLSHNKGISLRRGLVVFQFVIAQALIIGTLIIVRQMNDFTTRPLGFEKEAIVNVPFPGDSAGISKLNYLHEQLVGINGIQKISFSSNTPVEDNNDNWTTFRFDHRVKETDFFAITKWVDNDYVPTYQLPLLAGRNIAPSDTVREFLVNEKLVKNLGITNPGEALNKEISMWDDHVKGRIVGVLKDFNNRSFRAELAPVLLGSKKDWYTVAGIKLATKNASSAISAIEKLWNKVYPDFVFEYQFLDAKVDAFYKEEKKLSHLYKIFATIAIFLSCLGLYGLASFMATQRIKEVGIRKVLGATVVNIVYLFSKEFVVLIALAFVIASPVAWYFMNKWLENFPYRISIGWMVFAIAALSAIAIAFVTISFQAIKAAIANPVKSLRTE